jgi:hypothetical protein
VVPLDEEKDVAIDQKEEVALPPDHRLKGLLRTLDTPVVASSDMAGSLVKMTALRPRLPVQPPRRSEPTGLGRLRRKTITAHLQRLYLGFRTV